MKATLIYNTKAGNTNALSPEEIQDALYDVGYHPVYKATRHMSDLDTILEDAKGLIIAAGGDGTAKAVATRLIGNKDAALTILPMGTANNLAKTLGIAGSPLEIIKRLDQPHEHRFDMGHITAPWGEDYFTEGAGFGFFAQVLSTYDPRKGKSVVRSLQSLVDVFRDGYGQETTIRFPNQEISTEFLLAEVLNTRAIGPRLKFAPDADPTDGLLHLVCIDGEKQESYFNYLSRLLTEDVADMPSVQTYKVPHLEISWNGFPFHIDDHLQPDEFIKNDPDSDLPPRGFLKENEMIRVKVIPNALNVWLPKLPEGETYEHKF